MTATLPYEHVNGFCDGQSGGNAAGVVLPEHDAGLSDAQRLAAAAAIGFSETVFVSSVAMARGSCVVTLRYFTPEGEVDLCGHATIACLGLLHARDLLRGALRGELRTRAGDVAFGIEPAPTGAGGAGGATVFMEQLAPTISEPLSGESCARWAAALGGPALDQSWPPRVGSTGLRDLLVAVSSPEVLLTMRPDMQAISELSREAQLVGVHAFCFGDGSAASPLLVRNFAPLYGIDEESATGTSNCALACALRHSGRLVADECLFAQGDHMGMPSRIVVRLPPSGESRPLVGGRFHHVNSRMVAIPSAKL